MNHLWYRFWRYSHRKQSLSSFILTIGLVDAAIGSLSERSSLLSFGLLTILTAAIISVSQITQTKTRSRKHKTNTFLPPAPTGNPLPRLNRRKHSHS